MVVRPELPGDVPSIRQVHELAFGQRLEADLVDRLRRSCPELLSLVALDDGALTGHILFTPVAVAGVTGMGLGPMSVLPSRQGRGIGSALVTHGLDLLRDRGCPFVVVVGHPGYYPRFGFERASRLGLRCRWDAVPDEAFMALVFSPPAMAGVSGVVSYREEFDGLA
jgi:putative acetyltransferase